jgi:hypothetical protein
MPRQEGLPAYMSVMMIDNRMGKIACAVTAIMLASSAGAAKASEDINAGEWARMCESKSGFERGVCAGSAANFIDAMNDYQSRQSRLHGYPRHMFICWDPPPKVADVEKNHAHAMVAVRYLRSNPSYAEMPAPALMLAAFMRQWPCGAVGPIRKNP